MENQFTFGQKLVGVDFNPSKNPKVDRLKELFAEAIDIVENEWEDYTKAISTKDAKEYGMRASLRHYAIGEILNAQMNAVKFVVTDFDKF